jgi:hypothetical protein
MITVPVVSGFALCYSTLRQVNNILRFVSEDKQNVPGSIPFEAEVGMGVRVRSPQPFFLPYFDRVRGKGRTVIEDTVSQQYT